MKKLIIGTTATNRKNIHKITFPNWNKYLEKISNYEIIWIINFDFVEKFDKDYSYENFNVFIKKTINKKINVILLEKNNNPSLFSSVKKINEKIYNLLKNNIEKNNNRILWLEDDWDCIQKFNILDSLLDLKSENLYVNLTCRDKNYLGMLCPGILSYSFWKKYYYQSILLNTSNICPERCIQFYTHDNINNYRKIMPTINLILDKDNIDKDKLKYSQKNENYYGININDNVQELIDKLNYEVIFIRTFPEIAFDIGINDRLERNLQKKYTGRGRNKNFYYE